jgi:hypothetical protein
VKRGDYDHSHTLLSAMSTNQWVMAAIICISIVAVGGLIVGLAILDRL